MAILGTMTKQSREILDYDISYADFLSKRTDTLSTLTTEVTGGTGILTVTYSNISGSSIKVVVSGGNSGQSYKVTTLVTTTAGLKLEDEVNVLVQDV